jgi:formylglycine-generating enzyme required for sulfatase activity
MAAPDEKIRIFVCYSHSDKIWVSNNGLIPWLQKNLQRNQVEFWWDREESGGIRGGDTWRKRIADEIDRADIAILLISDDFASSPFIRDFEVPRIREKYNQGSLSIIPVLASPVSELGREDLAWVYDLQIVPSEGLSLVECQGSEIQWHRTRVKLQDEIYRRVKLHRTREAETPAPANPALTAAKPSITEARPTPKPGETKVNPKDGLTYVWIPPGKFMMGDSAREVTILKGFWLGQTPVTQAAFEKVMGANPSHFKGPNRPVESVTWDEARTYSERVGGRLPTEEEWEYAARGGEPGELYGELDKIAWYRDNSGDETHDVDQLEPNKYGLYDMLGNVWEWTADWYDEKHEYRSLRGGSWDTLPWYVCVSFRNGDEPGNRVSYFGFRCIGE